MRKMARVVRRLIHYQQLQLIVPDPFLEPNNGLAWLGFGWGGGMGLVRCWCCVGVKPADGDRVGVGTRGDGW